MFNKQLKDQLESNSITVFLIFSVLNNFLSFSILDFADHNNIIYYMRAVLGMLTMVLIFYQIIPFKYENLKLRYIYLIYTLNIPFISFFMYFSQIGNNQWLINLIITNFVLLYLVNFIYFIIITFLGIISSFLTYYGLYKDINNLYQYLLSNVNELIFMSAYLIIISSFFIYLKEKNKANKVQNMKNLAYSIAHDMRTPLSSIRYNIELLFGNLTSRAKKQAISQYNRALFLIDKTNINIDTMLLNIKQELRAKIQILNLSKIVEELIDYYPLNQEEKKYFKVVYENLVSEVEVDKSYFNHVVINILKNALYQRNKHHKGTIKLIVKADMVIIEDNIIGIKEDEQVKIFHPFYTEEKRGTGLGLSSSKMVMEKMGGKIICESVYLQYTRFILMFKKVRHR